MMEEDGEPRRMSNDSGAAAPEFEFWMMGSNPSSAAPPPALLTADELFVDGVLLPLDLLSILRHGSVDHPDVGRDLEPEPAEEQPQPVAPAEVDCHTASISCTGGPTLASKRWRDIFKVGEKKVEDKEREKEKEEKKERRRERKAGASAAAGAAEININIWPFVRSRSAGTGGSAGGRAKAAFAARKSSSAPCSRSNSRGESSKASTSAAGRRWAASPGRAGLAGGVHVGRNSPVWQIKKGGKITATAGAEARDRVIGGRKAGGGIRGLNLNVNTCIGYRSQLSCRSDNKDGLAGNDRIGDASGDRSLFNLRTLFSKKVVY